MRGPFRYVDLYSQIEVLYSFIEEYMMTKEEKLDKMAKEFSLLPDEKQDYILGVMQALTFAHDVATEGNAPFVSEENHELV